MGYTIFIDELKNDMKLWLVNLKRSTTLKTQVG
jgi:hypothetical protein